MKLTLPWWGGLTSKKFRTRVSTKRVQLSIAVINVRSTDLLNCNVKIWLPPPQCSAVCQYLLLCWGWTTPEISEEKGTYASCFYTWFLESFKGYILLLVALPDPLLHSFWFESPCYDVSTNVLNTDVFPQHSIAGMFPGITFIVLYSQEKLLWS